MITHSFLNILSDTSFKPLGNSQGMKVPNDNHQVRINNDTNPVTVVTSDILTAEVKNELKQDNVSNQLLKEAGFDPVLCFDTSDNISLCSDTFSSNVCQESVEWLRVGNNDQTPFGISNVLLSKHEDSSDIIADNMFKKENVIVNNGIMDNEKHTCEHCNRSFSSSTSLQQHLYKVIKELKSTATNRRETDVQNNENLQCEICNATLDGANNLKRHISEIHKDTKYNTKTTVDNEFENDELFQGINPEKDELIQRIDHEKDTCFGKQPEVVSTNEFRKRTHKTIEQRKFKCEKCNATLSCGYSLKRHISEVHNGVKYFAKRKQLKRISVSRKTSDDKRKQEIDTKEELSNEQIHPERKSLLINKIIKKTSHTTFQCEICNATLSCEYNLKRHISEVHNGVKYYTKRKPYKHNEDSQKETLDAQSSQDKMLPKDEDEPLVKRVPVNRNKRSVEKGTTFNCETCNASLNCHYDLRRHISEVHNGIKYQTHSKPYKDVIISPNKESGNKSEKDANFNGIGVKEENFLDGHANSITKNMLKRKSNKGSERKTFECKICNTSLSCDYSLKRHISEVHNRVKYKASSKLHVYTSKRSFDNRLQGETLHEGNRMKAMTEKEGLLSDKDKPVSKSMLQKQRKNKIKHEKFECKICSATVSSDYNLRRHISEVHDRVKYLAKQGLSKTVSPSIMLHNTLEKNIETSGEIKNTASSPKNDINKTEAIFDGMLEISSLENQFISINHKNIKQEALTEDQETKTCKKVCHLETATLTCQSNKQIDHDENSFEMKTQVNCAFGIKDEPGKEELSNATLHSKPSDISSCYENQGRMKGCCIICIYCGVKLNRKSIERHLIKVHQGIRIEHHSYGKLMDIKYSSHKKRNKDTNMSRVYPQNKPIKCTLCGVSFGTTNSLTNHWNQMHRNGPDIKSENTSLHRKYKNKNGTGRKSNVSCRQIIKFSCNKCDKVFTQLSEIKRHYRTAHVVNPHLQVFYYSCIRKAKRHKVVGHFLCDTCNTVHKTVDQLKNHAKSHLCTLSDKASANQIGHSVKHSRLGQGSTNEELIQESLSDKAKRDKKTVINCTFCQKNFSSHDKLQNHVMLHAGKMTYRCFACGNSFLCQKYLIYHMKRHVDEHVRRKTYTCNECKKQFSSFCRYKRHTDSSKHLPEGHFLCEICSKTFKRADSLKQHRKTHTENEHFCKLCGATFPRKDSLMRHYKIHSGEISHVCSICSKTCIDKYVFKRHMLIHDPNRKRAFLCKLCSKSFYTKLQLNRHERNVHICERNFACRFCGKSFFTQTYLNIHLKIHTDERSEICDICGKGFRLKAHLRAHLRMHRGEKLWGCEKCGVRYTDKRSYNRHIERCIVKQV